MSFGLIKFIHVNVRNVCSLTMHLQVEVNTVLPRVVHRHTPIDRRVRHASVLDTKSPSIGCGLDVGVTDKVQEHVVP